MMMSPAERSFFRPSITWSTGAPACTMMMTGTRRTNRGDEFLHRLAGNDAVAQGACFGVKGVSLVGTAIEDGDAVSFFRDVERQVGAHDRKSDQTDFRLFHARLPILESMMILAGL